MRTMRLGVARDDWPNLFGREPAGKHAFQHTLSTPAHTGHDNHRPIAPLLSTMQKADERDQSRILRVAVQIERSADFNIAAPDAALA